MVQRSRRVLIAAVLAAAVLPPPAGAAPEPEGKSKPVYQESAIETARVAMRDGETLFVEIRRPVVPSGVKVPVILTLSPYNDLSSPFPPDIGGLTDGESLAEFYVPRGYARAIADVRGTRESSGCWDYGGVKERHDGYDLVEWLGTRSWSNGKVAMIGASYEGTTANAAAVERPPHLATIVPIAAIDRWYDYAYVNGVRWLLNDENPTDEGFDTPAAFDFGIAVPPPVDARASAWAGAVQDRYTPCDQAAHTQHGYNPQPDYDDFWKERDYRRRAGGVTVPALVVHGLDDYNVKTTGGTELFERLAGPKRLLLGQWPHSGARATATGTWQNLLWRWFDRWLLGLQTEVMSERPVHIQDSAGDWHQEATWPPATTGDRTLWLGGSGALEPARSAASSATFVDDPTMTERRMMLEGADPARLRFMTEPLPLSARISGEPRLSLTLSSDQRSTHVAAYLVEVTSTGSTERISRGFLNPRYRGGRDAGADLEPGTAYDVSFALAPVDHVVDAGSRIALVVSGSNLIWAVPDPARARNTIAMGAGSSSSLSLPVVGEAKVESERNVRPREDLPATGVGAALAGAFFIAAALAISGALRRASR